MALTRNQVLVAYAVGLVVMTFALVSGDSIAPERAMRSGDEPAPRDDSAAASACKNGTGCPRDNSEAMQQSADSKKGGFVASDIQSLIRNDYFNSLMKQGDEAIRFLNKLAGNSDQK